jgi:hypothetical protein
MARSLAPLLALLAAAFLATRAAADDGPVVDLELVLAVDVSWSMDIEEQNLQREGYVAAIRDPAFIAALRTGDFQRIALTYVEWAGVGLERVVVPWAIVDGEASARAFADSLAAAPIARMRRTSISSALVNSARLFDNGINGMRQVIDISGDGPNNAGIPVTEARDEVLAKGITINGLPIMIKRGNPGGYFQLDDLDIYYEDCVIGGFGSFMITVDEETRFSEAIRRKLILEIAGLAPEVVPAQFRAPGSPPRIDCEIGEKEWRRWQRSDW